MVEIDERVRDFDRRTDQVFRSSTREGCQRVGRIRAVGPRTATSVDAAIGNGCEFDSGRHMVAWLGLIPRQHIGGDLTILAGISTREPCRSIPHVLSCEQQSARQVSTADG